MQIAVLSPHRDDAAFSCSLTLSTLLGAGHNLTIVNVCTISRYAPYLVSEDAGADLTEQVTERRRNEDASFVETLCALAGVENSRVEFVDLKWQDVPIRWSVQDEHALALSGLPPAEVQALGDTFRMLPVFDIVLAPMALGGHIDHRLVLQAARQAFSASSLLFYEDLPYACRMAAQERMSDGVESDLESSAAWLPEQGLKNGLKLAFALCYPSQIAVDVAEEMENYAAEHGGRERFLAGPQVMRTLAACLHQDLAL